MQQSSDLAIKIKQKNYQDLLIWQKAQDIFEMVCQDINKWPRSVITSAIANQIIRSSSSISTNISEGYGRGGPKEFEQFLRIARGSLAETDDWLYKSMREKLISEKRYIEYQAKIIEVSKMTASFINKLRGQNKKKIIAL